MPRGNPSSFKEAYVWHIKDHCVPDVARVVMALDFLLGGSQNYDIIYHDEGLAAWNIYTPVDLPQPRDLIAELRKIGAVKEEPGQTEEKAEVTVQADQPSEKS
ncbi:hypothetical protein FDECE_3393 [Fusarium decemcellulare]|nr:hypothetical protein FDECE_3393 [Fusarium decemcellulare]